MKKSLNTTAATLLMIANQSLLAVGDGINRPMSSRNRMEQPRSATTEGS